MTLALDFCGHDEELTHKILGLLVKVYAAAKNEAEHLESRYGVFAQICGSVLREPLSMQLVPMVFKTAETICIALGFFPEIAMKQLCAETARSALLTFTDTSDAKAVDFRTYESALNMLTNMAGFVNNLGLQEGRQ